MKKGTKQKLMCAVLIISGIALIVGGVFLSPLLIPGVPIFAGGLAVAASIYEDKDKVAFHTTINNIHNHEAQDGVSMPNVIKTKMSSSSKYSFSESARGRIEIWASALREVFAKAPKEVKGDVSRIPPLFFTHNYHYPSAYKSSANPNEGTAEAAFDINKILQEYDGVAFTDVDGSLKPVLQT